MQMQGNDLSLPLDNLAGFRGFAAALQVERQ
jgi:hypothetical protein